MARPYGCGVAALLSPVAALGLFFGILFGWAAIDSLVGAREVSRYIRDHRVLVARRLLDPKVHAFRLDHDPQDRGTLLIQLDVDDKATFDVIDADLRDSFGLKNPPRWELNVRSKEDLGNDWGSAAVGIGLAMEAAFRLAVALLASLALFVLILFLALRPPRQPSAPPVPEEGPPPG